MRNEGAMHSPSMINQSRIAAISHLLKRYIEMSLSLGVAASNASRGASSSVPRIGETLSVAPASSIVWFARDNISADVSPPVKLHPLASRANTDNSIPPPAPMTRIRPTSPMRSRSRTAPSRDSRHSRE